MPEQVAGAITREALVMAGFSQYATTSDWLIEWYYRGDTKILFNHGESTVAIITSIRHELQTEFMPAIKTIARLEKEIEAFEESLKPKQEPVTEGIPLSAEQFIADGWERTAGHNFYRQGMYACWVDNDRTWRLLVGNDDTIHTSMKSLKARIRELIDKKFQWLNSGI